jgi:hypothetical protein
VQELIAMTLLERFIVEECTTHVRALITNAIADPSSPGLHFEFNRFTLTARRDDGFVMLEDVLDATEAGAQRLTLDELTAALDRTEPTDER